MILGYIAISAIIIGCIVGVYFMVKDITQKIKRQNKYNIDFSKSFNYKGLPMIPMVINNEEKYFLLDSGSNINVITDQYFETLDIIGASENSEVHTGSGVSKSFMFKANLSHCDFEFNDTTFNVMDIPNMRDKESYGCDIVGILGAPFFNEYKWQLDFDELVVWINK